MGAYTTRFVDLLLSKHCHNGAAAQRFLLVLGAAFDVCKLRTASGVAGLMLVITSLVPLEAWGHLRACVCMWSWVAPCCLLFQRPWYNSHTEDRNQMGYRWQKCLLSSRH